MFFKVWENLPKKGRPAMFLGAALLLHVLANEELFPYAAQAKAANDYLGSYLPLVDKWSDTVLWWMSVVLFASFVYTALSENRLWMPFSVEAFGLVNVLLGLIARLGCFYLGFFVLGTNVLDGAWDSFVNQGPVILLRSRPVRGYTYSWFFTRFTSTEVKSVLFCLRSVVSRRRC